MLEKLIEQNLRAHLRSHPNGL